MKKLIILVLLILSAAALISCGGEPSDIPLEIADAAGNRFFLATNQAVDFHFYYPEDFILNVNAAWISVFVSDPEFADFGPLNPNMIVTVFSRAGNAADNVQEWWEDYIRDLSVIVQDIFIESSEDVVVAGIDGRKFIYSFTLGGQEYRQAKVIFFRNNEVYTLLYSATPARFNAHIRVLEVAIETFAFN